MTGRHDNPVGLSLALALAACNPVGIGEAAGFGGTGRAEMPFASDGSSVELYVDISLDEGRAEFSVLDPAGAIRYQRQVDSQVSLTTKIQLDGQEGVWLAVLSYSEARGTRSVDWRYR